MSDKYKVEKVVVRKRDVWVVVDGNGRVANDFRHKTKSSAETHCKNLKCFLRLTDRR